MSIEGLSPAQNRALPVEMLRAGTSAPRAYPLSYGALLRSAAAVVPGQVTAGDPAYSIPVAFRLTGKLNVAALRYGRDTIVARHASLRTTFAYQGGEPVRMV